MITIKNGVAEIWASLDPVFELDAVMVGFLQCFAGVAGKEHGEGAGAAVLDAALCCYVDERPFEAATQNTVLMHPEHGVELLRNRFAVGMPGADGGHHVATFLEFDWPDSRRRGREPAPEAVYGEWALNKIAALAFEGVRNTTWKDPYTSSHVQIAAGAVGLQSVHMAALLQVLEEDLQFNGPEAQLEQMQAVLLPVHARLVQFEAAHADYFAQRREQFLSLGMAVMARFAKNAHFLIQQAELSGPVDMSVGRNTDQKNDWVLPDQATLALRAWCERIGWDGFQEDRALAYLRHQKQDDARALEIVKQCVGLGKHTWPGLIAVLATPPISYQCQLEIISFMADPNWPGAGEAYDVIVHHPEVFAEALQECYAHAKEQGDESWMGMIGSLLGIEDEEDGPGG